MPVKGDKAGKSERAHLRFALKKRDPKTRMLARARLTNPHPYPETLRYLHGWARELHARSGTSGFGMNPLTWQAFDAWARRTGRAPDPAETDALFALDVVMLFPEESEDATRG